MTPTEAMRRNVEALKARGPQYAPTVMTMARRLARKAAERELQAQGLRPQRMESSDIRRVAQAYFDGHLAELIAEAEQQVLSNPTLRAMALPQPYRKRAAS